MKQIKLVLFEVETRSWRSTVLTFNLVFSGSDASAFFGNELLVFGGRLCREVSTIKLFRPNIPKYGTNLGISKG